MDKKAFFNTSAKETPEFSAATECFSPVYLALLDDHFVAFLSHDATVKPYLGPVDHWKTQTPVLREEKSMRRQAVDQVVVPVLREDGCMGLGLPRTFIRWLRFCGGPKKNQEVLVCRKVRRTDSLVFHLTLQVWPSSRAAFWASTGLSMTRPVRPEKSMATREFSDTLRCGGVGRGGDKGQRSQTVSVGHDQSCLHMGALPSKHTPPPVFPI